MAATPAMSIAAAGSAYSQAQAARAQGDYQKKMYDLNAQMANFQAEDAVKRGDKEAESHLKKVKQMQGSQRAALAAQGIEVDSGSAADIQSDTFVQGRQDAAQIRSNAWREAWGYKVQAADFQSQGVLAEMAGKNSYRNSLLSGGMQAIGYGAQGIRDSKRGKETVK